MTPYDAVMSREQQGLLYYLHPVLFAFGGLAVMVLVFGVFLLEPREFLDAAQEGS